MINNISVGLIQQHNTNSVIENRNKLIEKIKQLMKEIDEEENGDE